MKIFDFLKRPVKTATITEPQTAKITQLKYQWHDANTAQGLSPAKLNSLFQNASRGNLSEQAALFESMLERDAHLFAEMDKRKSAPLTLEWSIEPPRNASAQEKDLAAYADELIRDVIEFDDMVKALQDGIGHGFSALEITWNRDGNEWLPKLDYRPQSWFQLPMDRSQIRLIDGSMDGAELQPFSWMLHIPDFPKTGYLGQHPLYRVLAWPFLYKLYGISDFAEFLEIYGLPIITGKYNAGATDDQQRKLLSAVKSLGHDARAIMPADMAIEIQTASSGSGSNHLDMVTWAEKSMSKCILGATLSSQADGKTSTNALGNVHNEVRHDIRDADCRQLATTITRDLIYPILMLNKGGIESLRRCPRIVFDTSEAEDLALYADGLPKLVSIGMKIPASYAHDKLKIPLPENDEDVLGMQKLEADSTQWLINEQLKRNQGNAEAAASFAVQLLAATPEKNRDSMSETISAALKESINNQPKFTQAQQQVEDIANKLMALNIQPIDPNLIYSACKAASDPQDLENRLAALLGNIEQTDFNNALAVALFTADCLGYTHAQQGR